MGLQVFKTTSVLWTTVLRLGLDEFSTFGSALITKYGSVREERRSKILEVKVKDEG